MDGIVVDLVKVTTPSGGGFGHKALIGFEAKVAHPGGFGFVVRDFFDGCLFETRLGDVSVGGGVAGKTVLIGIFDEMVAFRSGGFGDGSESSHIA